VRFVVIEVEVCVVQCCTLGSRRVMGEYYVNCSMFVLSTRYRGQVLDIDRNAVYRHID
jgi:hypothetical protein